MEYAKICIKVTKRRMGSGKGGGHFERRVESALGKKALNLFGRESTC
jgi:hypothetical protein